MQYAYLIIFFLSVFGLLTSTSGCDSAGPLMTSEDVASDSSETVQEPASRDSLFLVFTIGYGPSYSGFFNVSTGGNIRMLDLRSSTGFNGAPEYGIWKPLVSPSGKLIAYFQTPMGNVTLLEGSLVESFTTSSRTDFNRTVDVSKAHWSKDERSIYFRTGFGIANVGYWTTFELDFETDVVQIVADKHIPVGRSSNGNVLLKNVENSLFYELDDATYSLVLFDHPVIKGHIYHVEWSASQSQYVLGYQNNDDRWIGIAESSGPRLELIASNYTGEIAFGKPRWGNNGEIYYDQFTRRGDRPTVIMKYDPTLHSSSIYLTAKQMGFDSNTVHLADILRLESKK